MGNFSFLNKYWPELGEYGDQTECYIYSDPNASLIKQRVLGEKMIEILHIECYGERKRKGKTFYDMLEQLARDNEISKQIADIIHQVRQTNSLLFVAVS